MKNVFRAYLLLFALANFAGVFYMVLTFMHLLEDYPKLTPVLVGLLAAAGLVAVVAAALMWLLKLSGFVLVVLAYGGILAIQLHYGAPTAELWIRPAALFVLLLLALPLRASIKSP